MERDKLVQLVSAAQNGDHNAFNELFNTFQPVVYSIAMRETKNPETAADVTQETFIEVIETIGKLQEPAAFVSWLKTIAYHQCTRYYRKKEAKHEQLLEEREDAPALFDTLEEANEEFIPDKALENEEFCKTIRTFITNLPDTQRSAIMMMYFDGLSVKEIATAQGVPENTVLSRLYYGRKAIKAAVEDYEKKHDTKLHAIPFLPLLRGVFSEAPKRMSAKAVSAVAKGIGTATGIKITATGVGVAGTIAAMPLAAKIAAGVTAVVVAVATPVAVSNIINKPDMPSIGSNISTSSNHTHIGTTTTSQEDKPINLVNTLSEQDLVALNRHLSCLSEQSALNEYPTTDESMFHFAVLQHGVANNWPATGGTVTTKEIDAILNRFFGETITAQDYGLATYQNGAFVCGEEYASAMRETGGFYMNFWTSQLGDDLGPCLSLVREVYETNGIYRVNFNIYEFADIDITWGPWEALQPDASWYAQSTDNCDGDILDCIGEGYAVFEKNAEGNYVITHYAEYLDKQSNNTTQETVNNTTIGSSVVPKPTETNATTSAQTGTKAEQTTTSSVADVLATTSTRGGLAADNTFQDAPDFDWDDDTTTDSTANTTTTLLTNEGTFNDGPLLDW